VAITTENDFLAVKFKTSGSASARTEDVGSRHGVQVSIAAGDFSLHRVLCTGGVDAGGGGTVGARGRNGSESSVTVSG